MEKVLEELAINELSGEKGLILFFYPKAGTSGCSLEAREYNKRLKDFQAIGYNVAGISADSEEENEEFSNECSLDYPLISDTSKKYVEQYKVWGEKKMFGMPSQGIIRSTFVIDPSGKTILEKRNVEPVEHIQELYLELKK